MDFKDCLRDTSHPYLHDLFKCVLVYSPEKAFKEFILANPKSKLGEWKLIESRQEYILKHLKNNQVKWARIKGENIEQRYKICDAMWKLEKTNRNTYAVEEIPTIEKRIVHEIKTGYCNLYDIYAQYADMRVDDHNTVTGMDNLWIWTWKGKINTEIPEPTGLFEFDRPINAEDIKKFKSALKQKRVRVMNLNILLPILNDAMNEIMF